MKIIGITGSVASGKNLLAEILVKNGAEIFDADKVSHQLLESDWEVITTISQLFPQSFVEGKINRQILSDLIFKSDNHQANLNKLEKVIHPKVRQSYQQFLQDKSSFNSDAFIALNIPLLIESSQYDYDILIAITADNHIKKKRYIARELTKNANANLESLANKFETIINMQISDQKRKEAADFIIENNGTKQDLEKRVISILKKINGQ